ncbi:astacin-like metalloendopeptidase, partial [Hyperolius riggenbachi]|uniref:astacin-like metalloendopeptidase n=1 Tax=Hyperolius riggenbachi TaxID=752182 RepID=UPI0035A31C72
MEYRAGLQESKHPVSSRPWSTEQGYRRATIQYPAGPGVLSRTTGEQPSSIQQDMEYRAGLQESKHPDLEYRAGLQESDHPVSSSTWSTVQDYRRATIQYPAGPGVPSRTTGERPSNIQKDLEYRAGLQESDHPVSSRTWKNEIIPQGSMSCSTCQWPKSSDGIVYVPYTLASDYLSLQKTLLAQWLQEISTLTCVNFVERTTETDYLAFQSHGGCWSYIGNVGGTQAVGVDMQFCMPQSVFQHEVLHALGFNHEVQRKDRDQYVKILYNNIMPGQKSMFDIINNYVPVLSYDYNSVMHYDSNEYSQHGANTLVPIPNPNVPFGQKVGVSPMDIDKVNALYQCNLCSNLFNGDSGVISSANYPSPYPSDSSCLYLIRIPANKILLTFQAFDIEGSTQCSSDYLRVYDGLTTSSPVLLDKTCGNTLPYPLMSSNRVMLFEFVSDGAVSGAGFQASYSTVLCGGIYTENNGAVTSPN